MVFEQKFAFSVVVFCSHAAFDINFFYFFDLLTLSRSILGLVFLISQ